jgi:dTMP kinase
MNGHLISFEGVDASGKSSQVPLLKSWLQEQNIHSITVREPGGTPLAEDVRSLILRHHHNVPEETACLLFNAARVHLVSTVIKPALEQGTWIIADRYFDSSLAYQRNLPELNASLKNLLHIPMPSLTFLFDLPVEIAIKRNHTRAQTPDHIDNQSKKLYQETHDAYQKIAHEEHNKKRFCIINAQKTIQDLAKDIQDHISSRLLSS